MTASGSVRSYRDLDVWQLAIELTVKCYRLTSKFPEDEAYGLSSQIRRSAVSIAANIAEGWGRDQTGQFIQFLRISQGSARELETHLIVAERVGLSLGNAETNPAPECERVCKMLRALIRSLEVRR